jgi:hypothetical protein
MSGVVARRVASDSCAQRRVAIGRTAPPRAVKALFIEPSRLGG